METAALKRLLSFAKPSLGAMDGVLPILSHFCFDDGVVYAYNDILATVVFDDHGISACGLHGGTLLDILDVAGVDNINISGGKDKVCINVGSGKVDIPSLSSESFVFEMPDVEFEHEINITADLCKGMELCLGSIAQDSIKEEFNGVTFDIEKGEITLYSSNNRTASRYVVDGKVKKLTTAFVLPTPAAEQVLRLRQQLPNATISLGIAASTSVVTFDSGENDPMVVMISKLTEAKAPFRKIFSANASDVESFDNPPQLSLELKKASVVLGKEVIKDCILEFAKGKIKISAKGQLGQMETSIPCASKTASGAANIEPQAIVRALTVSDQMTLGAGSLVFTKGSYTYVVASKQVAQGRATGRQESSVDEDDIPF